jgi:predicted NAD-dependent protein-ADP-ribosyltransferase YbiA (DUF1768 family)
MNPRELLSPRTDGIDHLNIYSRGRTAEGRLLSNFAETPFVLDGVRFASVEAWYQAPRFDHEAMRRKVTGMSGAPCKKLGDTQGKKAGAPVRLFDGRIVPYDGADYRAAFSQAIRAKVAQNPDVRNALMATESLALTHYYVMMGRPVMPRGEDGVLAGHMNAIRAEQRHQGAARFLLGPLAAAGLHDLLRQVRGGDAVQRCRAMQALAFRADADDLEVADTLAGALDDADLEVCHRALRSLVQMELPATIALPIYRKALLHRCAAVRAVAAKMLGQLGAAAHPAMLDLLAAKNDVEKIVRLFAEAALERLEARVSCAV